MVCRGDLVSPVLVGRIYRYMRNMFMKFVDLVYINPVLQMGWYNFSSAQVRLRSFRCERLHLTFLNSAFASLGFIGIGHEQASPYRPSRNIYSGNERICNHKGLWFISK